MTNKQKISDIQYLINEFYSTEKDRNGLSESAEKSKKIFNQFCRDIAKDLEVLEKIIQKEINISMVLEYENYNDFNENYNDFLFSKYKVLKKEYDAIWKLKKGVVK